MPSGLTQTPIFDAKATKREKQHPEKQRKTEKRNQPTRNKQAPKNKPKRNLQTIWMGFYWILVLRFCFRVFLVLLVLVFLVKGSVKNQASGGLVRRRSEPVGNFGNCRKRSSRRNNTGSNYFIVINNCSGSSRNYDHSDMFHSLL